MQMTLEIPDALADRITADGRDPARVALEAMAIEGYRARQLSEFEMRVMLGFDSRFELWDFLGAHEVPRNYSIEDWEHDKRIVKENVIARQRQLEESAS